MNKNELETKPLTDEEVVKLHKRVLAIEEILAAQNKPGAKKEKEKTINELKAEYQAKNQKLGVEFMARYNALVQFMGIEVRAVMETNPYQPNVAQAVTRMQPYREKEKKTKPWHEAMADNLHTRAACEHVEHAEGELCEKCGLPVVNWGKSNKGVSQEYLERQRARIEEEKKKAEETKE